MESRAVILHQGFVALDLLAIGNLLGRLRIRWFGEVLQAVLVVRLEDFEKVPWMTAVFGNNQPGTRHRTERDL